MIEFAQPDAQSLQETFVQAKMLAKVHKNDAKTSKWYDYLQRNVWLVTYKGQSDYIDAAWVVSIEIE